jgi:hypothetical protein
MHLTNPAPLPWVGREGGRKGEREREREREREKQDKVRAV